MSYQKELETLVTQLQTELHQMHDRLLEEISKSKKLESKCNALKEKLSQQENLLYQIIDMSPNLICVHDEDGQFILANQAFAQIYNTSTKNLMGKTNKIFKVSQPQSKHVLEPEPVSPSFIEECLVLPTGERRHFQIYQTPVIYNNCNSNQTLCVCFDITANKLLNEQINVYSKNEAKLKEMICNFITTTSHEFRTPLTTILGSSELLGCYGKNWSDEKIAYHLNRIQTSVEHMVLMLDNLLFLEDKI